MIEIIHGITLCPFNLYDFNRFEKDGKRYNGNVKSCRNVNGQWTNPVSENCCKWYRGCKSFTDNGGTHLKYFCANPGNNVEENKEKFCKDYKQQEFNF